MPQRAVSDSVGGTAIGRSVQDMAAREGLTVRQTYQRILPSMGGNMLKGTPSQVADGLEAWYNRQGFATASCSPCRCSPAPLRDFVELVVPELQRRGLFRTEYAGATLRANMGLAVPPDPFATALEMAAD